MYREHGGTDYLQQRKFSQVFNTEVSEFKEFPEMKFAADKARFLRQLRQNQPQTHKQVSFF